MVKEQYKNKCVNDFFIYINLTEIDIVDLPCPPSINTLFDV